MLGSDSNSWAEAVLILTIRELFAGPSNSCSGVSLGATRCNCTSEVGCSIRLACSFFSAAVKALDRRASEMMPQRMLDPTDETNSAMPCPNRLVDMATIARMKVATKKTNPRPKIQNVRNPRIRQIQPALTADDFAGGGFATCNVPGSGLEVGIIARKAVLSV